MYVYVHTFVIVSEHRSGYDGSPLSADAPPSSSAGSKSSLLWRSAIENIKRILFFFWVKAFCNKTYLADVLLISKLALQRNLVAIRSVLDLMHDYQCLCPQR